VRQALRLRYLHAAGCAHGSTSILIGVQEGHDDR